MAQNVCTLKLQLRDEIRRVKVPGGLASYADVEQALASAWPELIARDVRLVPKYRDDDGDLCTLSGTSFTDFVALSQDRNAKRYPYYSKLGQISALQNTPSFKE